MIEPMAINGDIDFISKLDKEEKQTIWKFRNLSLEEEIFLKRLAINSGGSPLDFIDSAPTFLHVALKGADNYKGTFVRDEKAACIIGEIKPWNSDTIMQLKPNLRDELIAFVITGYMKLEEEELKN